MAIQQTLVLVKPDGVSRGLSGEVIRRFERVGLKVVGLKLVRVDMDRAKKHYTEDISERHGEKIRGQLLSFITEGPVVAMVLEGVDAIENVRKMIGSTESKSALPGTIRGDFSLSIQNTIIHASDSKETAEKEIWRFFSQDELFGYERLLTDMIYSETEKD